MSSTVRQSQSMDGRRLRHAVSDVSSELNKIEKNLEAIAKIEEVEQAECDCCGLKEDCTQDYIATVKHSYSGKWVCGLCSEAVKEIRTKTSSAEDIQAAINSHRTFCLTTRLNPKLSLANAMRNIAKRSFENRKTNDSSKILRSSSCIPSFSS